MYSDGSYLEHNPDWHAEDSAWKARHIASILRRNHISPTSIADVGCGAGEVLISLADQLDPDVRFDGYDISPDAYAICKAKSTNNVHFHLANLLHENEYFDLVLAIDVFEHVEDYFSFLRQLRTKAKYKIFHIPLELSALMVARSSTLIRERRTVGHIHHFSKETALATLEDTGYRVIDHFYTASRVELGNPGWKTRALKMPRRMLLAVSPDAATRLLGGYSMLVLAE